ncbi:DUF3470 domain-containing protein [Cupriavidus necator]|uniref:DUF3470 domain-containing protein n=1 Tax=Cupriavidus necator TaxID=106590 RepID=UPI0039C331E9
MTYVVTEPCINCRHGDCIEVCPVQAFHQGQNFMVIDPEVCINCSICEAVCPVSAIKSDFDLAPHEEEFVEINRRMAKQWPLVTVAPQPLPEAEAWASSSNKRVFLKL